MIQLANDPNASRLGLRTAPPETKSRGFDHARTRGGHAWPFLSHHAGRPAPQAGSKTTSSDSGS